MLTKFFTKMQSKMQEEKGQGLVEYALIIFMVSIAVILILPNLGARIGVIFNQIITALGG